jgi:hypothetical protein
VCHSRERCQVFAGKFLPESRTTGCWKKNRQSGGGTPVAAGFSVSFLLIATRVGRLLLKTATAKEKSRKLKRGCLRLACCEVCKTQVHFVGVLRRPVG